MRLKFCRSAYRADPASERYEQRCNAACAALLVEYRSMNQAVRKYRFSRFLRRAEWQWRFLGINANNGFRFSPANQRPNFGLTGGWWLLAPGPSPLR
jgi:hypothetical protein